MKTIRASIKFVLANVALFLWFFPILISVPFPVHFRGIRVTAWLATLLARTLMRIFGLKLDVTNRNTFIRHQGFIFPNHISYTDILALVALSPVRFLAKAEIRSWPLIGQIAAAIGCVFVQRENKDSRRAARNALVGIAVSPPIVLFPEGNTGPPGPLRPFRYGAFEIVIDSDIPFLPCIIRYDEPELVFWGDETLVHAVWRLCQHRGTINVGLVPLRAIKPEQGDNAKTMAIAIHGAMDALLTSLSDEAKIIQSGF